jgi:hypothetical protein
MAAEQLERRVTALEAEVARLRDRLEKVDAQREAVNQSEPWWRKIAGTFEGDPIYAEAMRLGRQYRESLRPKLGKRPKRDK